MVLMLKVIPCYEAFELTLCTYSAIALTEWSHSRKQQISKQIKDEITQILNKTACVMWQFPGIYFEISK